jgi:hypothetical protein
MKNYTISVGRESDSEFISYPFSYEVTVKLDAEELWQALLQEFKDYKQGWMWPTQYSQPSIDQFPPRKGGALVLTYQMPDPRDASKPKQDLTYDFEITGYQHTSTERYLDYGSGKRHPFLGGGRMSVAPVSDTHAKLSWEGVYKFRLEKMHREPAGQIFSYYFPNFFNGFTENIKKKIGFD